MQTIKEQLFDLQLALEHLKNPEQERCENIPENSEGADLVQKYEEAVRNIEEIIKYLSETLAIRAA